MGPPRRGGGVGLGDGLAAKRTFVGRSPRPYERAEQAEPKRCLLSVFSDGKVTPEQVRGDIRGF